MADTRRKEARKQPARNKKPIALRRWEELNERQRAYLKAVYRADQKEEEFQRSAWSRGGRAAPAEEWRWILYGNPLVETSLMISLQLQNLVDKGTGATFAALADRDLLLTRHSIVNTPLGPTEVLEVRMSTKGRQAVRAGNPEPPPEGCLPGERRLPPGTLKEWHWRALAKAYTAGEDGLAEDGISYAYGRIGYRTWQRLQEYRAGAFGPLVKTRRLGLSGKRLFITAEGKRFYEEHLEEYRQRYPQVEVSKVH